VHNFVVDRLKKQVWTIRESDLKKGTKEAALPTEDDDSGGPEEAALPTEDDDSGGPEPDRLEAVRREAENLEFGDAVLLEVLFPWSNPMPDSRVRALAEMRGVSPQQVVEELEDRKGILERETPASNEIERRSISIGRLQDRIRRVHAVIMKCDGCLAEPVDITEERLSLLRRSERGFRSATPAERSAVLSHMQGRLDKLLDAQKAPSRRASRGALHDWRSVARILGEVSATATEKDLRLAENRLVTRWRRLRKRLAGGKQEERR
jgi:hypothetical protein